MALVNTGSRLGNLSDGERNIGERGQWWDNGGPIFAGTKSYSCSKRRCHIPNYGRVAGEKCEYRRVVCSRSEAGGPGYNRLTTDDATGTGHPDSPYVKKIGYYSPLLTDKYRRNYQIFDKNADIISLKSLVSTNNELAEVNESIGSILENIPVIGKLNLKLILHEQDSDNYPVRRGSILSLFGRRIKHDEVIDNAIPLDALYFDSQSINVESSSISFSSSVVKDIGYYRILRDTYDITMDFTWKPYGFTRRGNSVERTLNAHVLYNCLIATGQLELKMSSLPEVA